MPERENISGGVHVAVVDCPAIAADPYFWKGVLWSPSYFAGSVDGAPISVLRQYIEQQQRPV